MSEYLKHHPLPEQMSLRMALEPANKPRLWESTDNPNLLVREERTATSEQALKDVAVLLRELESVYGIRNSGYYPFLTGDSKDSRRAYVLTNRVQGISLDEAINTRQSDVLVDLSKHYDGLIKYLQDKYVNGNGQKFMSDIFTNAQYMFGHVKEEEDDSILLIDVGGEVEPVNNTGILADVTAENMIEHAMYLYMDISEVSARTGAVFPALGSVIKFLNSVSVKSTRHTQLVSLVNAATERGETVASEVIEEILDNY